MNKKTENIKNKITSEDIKESNFFEQIFSVKNTRSHKVIQILGIKIKISKSEFIKKYYKLPVQKNKIVFANFMGNGYGCNPKYIAEEIIKRNLPYDLVWLVKNKTIKQTLPPQFRTVKFSSIQALKELITAKVWVDNQLKGFHILRGLIKRDEQFYIQTWHGSLGIKRIANKTQASDNTAIWPEESVIDEKTIDVILSNSDFEDEVFKDFMWTSDTIKTGHPRNDVFFKDSKNIKEKVRKFYNIDKNKKILLYVPTFRKKNDLSWNNINYQKTLNEITKRFGGDWLFMLRHHPIVADMGADLTPKDNFVVDVTKYPDIQELLVMADIVITDYSSCIFDFMLSEKPAFIYASDLEKYNKKRGFYYPIESTPFPIALNNEELIENIKNFDYDKYKTDVEEFLKDKGCMEDGHASKRVVDLIEEIINKKN